MIMCAMSVSLCKQSEHHVCAIQIADEFESRLIKAYEQAITQGLHPRHAIYVMSKWIILEELRLEPDEDLACKQIGGFANGKPD